MAASSASIKAQLPADHAAAMRDFRDHADNTNDIFLVAAQAIAHSLITANVALVSGKCIGCLWPLVISLFPLLGSTQQHARTDEMQSASLGDDMSCPHTPANVQKDTRHFCGHLTQDDWHQRVPLQQRTDMSKLT